MRTVLRGASLVRGLVGGVVVGGVLLGGCAEDVDSSDVKTSGMYADFSVTGRGDGRSEVRAAIRIGGGNSNTYADLTAGDVLSATSGADTHTLTKIGGTLGKVHIYGATFDGAEAGQAFNIAFDRADDDSAPESNSMLPDAFDITAPVANAEVSRTEALTVTWTPSTSSAVEIDLDGDCVILDSHNASSDSGSYTFEADSIRPSAGKDGDTCNVEIVVTTRRSGTVDSAFGEGGRFNAHQQRSVTFRSTP